MNGREGNYVWDCMDEEEYYSGQQKLNDEWAWYEATKEQERKEKEIEICRTF